MKKLIIFALIALWSCSESKEDKVKSELRVLYCNVRITQKSAEKFPKSTDILQRNIKANEDFKKKVSEYQGQFDAETWQKIMYEVFTDKRCE